MKICNVPFPIVVSATSAAGKDSFFQTLRTDLKCIEIIPRITTRGERKYDSDSSLYIFDTPGNLYDLSNKGKLLFLEENYGGRLYGVLATDIDKSLAAHKIPLIIANSDQGVLQILEKYPDALYIFILPSDQDLGLRLISWDDSTQAEIELGQKIERLIRKRNRGDFDLAWRVKRSIRWAKQIHRYDTVVFNRADANGSAGKVFHANYQSFLNFVLKEVEYREFLLELSKFWKCQWKNGNPRIKESISSLLLNIGLTNATMKLPTEDCLFRITVALRSLRKEGLREKDLVIDLFELPTRNARQKHAINILSYTFAPFVPMVEALKEFRHYDLISRIIIIRKEKKIFIFNPHDQTLTISENLFAPMNSLSMLKNLIKKEEHQNRRAVAEIPCILKIEKICRGKFREKSQKFEEVAKKFLSRNEKENFMNLVVEYSQSDDWYNRRLAAEALSSIEIHHPDRKEIVATLLVLITDPKIGQISDPALKALELFAQTNYMKKQIKIAVLKLLKVPERAWAREMMLEVLGTIGDDDCQSAILEELGNTERYKNRLACLKNIEKFEFSENIIDALLHVSKTDQVPEIRNMAKRILTNYQQKVKMPLSSSKFNKSLITSKKWIERVRSIRLLSNSHQDLNEVTLLALSHPDWRVKYTGIHLLSESLRNIEDEVILKILSDPHPSLRQLMAKKIVSLENDIIERISSWLEYPTMWSQVEVIRILSKIAKKNPKHIDTVIRTLYEQVQNSQNTIVRACATYELGTLVSRHPYSHCEIKDYLKTLSSTENETLLRWSAIEGLDCNVSSAHSPVEPLNVSLKIRKLFLREIRNFNITCKKESLGRIDKVIFEDSSYSKPHPIFCFGSDFDMFRIIYSGKIPKIYKIQLRDKLWGLGVYIKPDEPTWIKTQDKANMFKTAVDVMVFHDGKGMIQRPVNNDFIENKTELRRQLFRSMNDGSIRMSGRKLICKLHRRYVLQRILGVNVDLFGVNPQEIKMLKGLIKEGYISQSCYHKNKYKLNWVTYDGKFISIEKNHEVSAK